MIFHIMAMFRRNSC